MDILENFKIVIPMTGYGSRFVDQGFKKLKPFIEVHNKPIIEWVVKMFPGDEDKILFVCREKHLEEHEYIKSELERIAPNAKIFSISDWKKRGPVIDVLKACHLIEDHCPIIVSYCDYYMHWNYKKFKHDVVTKNCDGSVPCYTNFHPHLIPEDNLYASCKVDDNENLIEIREKFAWNKNKMLDLNSPGVYFFKNKDILTKYSNQMIDENDHINNEYYMSLPFNYLVKDGLKVWCPANIEKFCQWGTPEDLSAYIDWINFVANKKEFGKL
tara:strand:- start:5455 stop:6264 length:810 start_codon:yes stop_codon:yes gene_type:complete